MADTVLLAIDPGDAGMDQRLELAGAQVPPSPSWGMKVATVFPVEPRAAEPTLGIMPEGEMDGLASHLQPHIRHFPTPLSKAGIDPVSAGRARCCLPADCSTGKPYFSRLAPTKLWNDHFQIIEGGISRGGFGSDRGCRPTGPSPPHGPASLPANPANLHSWIWTLSRSGKFSANSRAGPRARSRTLAALALSPTPSKKSM